MTNIVPNVMAQTNMSLLETNYKAFQPIASGLFTYNGPATEQTDNQVKNARLLLQNIINILPSLMQAINTTPTLSFSPGPLTPKDIAVASPYVGMTNQEDVRAFMNPLGGKVNA